MSTLNGMMFSTNMGGYQYASNLPSQQAGQIVRVEVDTTQGTFKIILNGVDLGLLQEDSLKTDTWYPVVY